MDYLDPKKQSRHRTILFVGYIFIAIGITIGTIILVELAYGFGIGKNGTVIQNGLTFFSSHPRPASIYVNGQLKPKKTNTRLVLPEGIYNIRLSRSGYYDWKRIIELDGGSVEHFDYPFLIPKKLSSDTLKSYSGTPGLSSQSPDHRWLIIGVPGSASQFEIFDLKNPAKAPLAATLPADLLTKPSASESLKPIDWADDNQHLLIEHDYDGKVEFALLDRANPDKSLNLNKTLNLNPGKLTLIDKKYDKYYVYEAARASLQTVSLGNLTPQPFIDHVLAYQSYGSSTVLYATDVNAPSGKVNIALRNGSKTYNLRSLAIGSNYLLNLTKYSGTMYVAAGADTSDKVYIYKDPVGQLQSQPNQAVTPIQVLHVPAPNYLSFSTSAQFIVAEGGSRFGVYDIENEKGYSYSTALPIDQPQLHASWMDGNRLTFVSGGKLAVFDYDNTNQHLLVSAASQYLPAFTPDYKRVIVLAPAAPAAAQTSLNQTFLLTPADR